MSCFHDHVADYLEARRALGPKLVYPGFVLARFATYLEAAGAGTLTVELAVEFAGLPQGVSPKHLSRRLSVLRGFARYLKTVGPATEVPPAGVWPAGQVRPAPYIWAEEDITRLVDAAKDLRPRLKGLTLGTLFGLLASSGIRVGEALGLAAGDVDLGSGLLTIRNGEVRPRTLRPAPPDHDRGAPPLRPESRRPRGGTGQGVLRPWPERADPATRACISLSGTSLLNWGCARPRCTRGCTTCAIASSSGHCSTGTGPVWT